MISHLWTHYVRPCKGRRTPLEFVGANCVHLQAFKERPYIFFSKIQFGRYFLAFIGEVCYDGYIL